MEQNPYESPEPPEEPVAFREIGKTWPGWRKFRDTGILSFGVGMLGVISIGLWGVNPNMYVGAPFGVLLLVGLILIVVGRFGAYLHSIVLMFRGDYD